MKALMASMVTLLLLSVLAAPATLADTGGGHMEGGHMMDGWGMGMGALWILLIMFIIAAIVIWFIQVLTADEDRHSGAPPRSYAHQLLDERYARGELDAEDYYRMKNDLYWYR